MTCELKNRIGRNTSPFCSPLRGKIDYCWGCNSYICSNHQVRMEVCMGENGPHDPEDHLAKTVGPKIASLPSERGDPNAPSCLDRKPKWEPT